LPGVVFRLKEKTQLWITLGFTFICLIGFDPIHEMLGVGYYQRGFTGPSYYYINYITAISFIIMLWGVFILRSVMENAEHNLQRQNLKLQQKQREIEYQHGALLQQQEEIISSSEKLEDANQTILRQQAELEKYNAQLEALVTEKSHELVKTNEELVKHNNELLQFSYTVSHNLRGPVARLLGLTRLSRISEEEGEKKYLETLLEKSGEELDTILRDLSQIIDIRNELYGIREKVFLEEEWKKTTNLLDDSIKPEYDIRVCFRNAPYVYGVRPMLQSIFYNLFSNAIKYQSPDRTLNIEVRSFQTDDSKTIIEIRDNGLGIDLEGQGKNVFKLYKRFHTHVSGKGLGLYLVKTQVEAMGGEIIVESRVNEGTLFRIAFREPETVNKQIFYESEASQLYFDANLNITVIIWKKSITSAEYHSTFEMVLNSLKTYRSPGWIADLRNQGIVTDDDQAWFISKIVPEAVKCGLKRLAAIGLKDPVRMDYYNRVSEKMNAEGVELKVFGSMHDAINWMKSYR
jgi:signal transduction histidine kinase